MIMNYRDSVDRNKNNIIGFTLIEILIGVVISAIMMGAMFTTYTVVNNSYSQVSDVAGISRSGRDIVTLMMRDIRLAGFKYHYCLLYTSPSPRDQSGSRMPSSA